MKTKTIPAFLLLVAILSSTSCSKVKTLEEAIYENDSVKVRQILEKNPELVHANDESYSKEPLIILASSDSSSECLKVFIEFGADVNAQAEDGNTPIRKAIIRREGKALKLLIESGAVFNLNQGELEEIFFKAHDYHEDFLVALFDYVEEEYDEQFLEFLYQAVRAKQFKVVKKLLSMNVDINRTIEDWGAPPLFSAFEKKDIAMTRLLLEAGANPNLRDNKNDFPLTYVYENNSMDFVKLLLEFKADHRAGDSEGVTLFHMAVLLDDIELFTLLDEYGLDLEEPWTEIYEHDREYETVHLRRNEEVVEKKAGDLYSPLMMAILNNSSTMIELLLKKGVDINKTGKDGHNALLVACKVANYELVKRLLELGADIKHRAVKGETPYMMAAYANSLELMKFIAESGGDTGFKPGTTSAIHYAAGSGAVNAVDYLLKSGVPLTLKDSKGKDAMYWAIRGESIKMVDYLFSKGLMRRRVEFDRYKGYIKYSHYEESLLFKERFYEYEDKVND